MTGDLRRIAFALTLFAGAACGTPPPAEPADLILINLKGYSLNWPDPSPDGTPDQAAPYKSGLWTPDFRALAIRNGLIEAIGDEATIMPYKGDSTHLIDLQGATVVPGLVESHAHLAELGESLLQVNLVGVKDEQEAVERVKQRSLTTPEGQWIVGWGWDEGAWADRYPTLELLSREVPNHPVYLKGLHGFAVWVNQATLERAGISSDVQSPTGGEVLRDGQGRLTGIFLNRARQLVEKELPPADAKTTQDRLEAALSEMARSGYVAAHEAGASAETVSALEELEKAGRLPIRVYCMLNGRDPDLLRKWADKGPVRGDWLSIGSVKAYYDGALGSRGARLLADYSDQRGHRGVSGSEYGFDSKLLQLMIESGFQTAIHAIGDAGNRETLDFLEGQLSADPGSRQLRHRIEHAQVVDPADRDRFRKLGVIASMQPPHAVEDMGWAEARLGPERVRHAYAWRSLRSHGARLIFNSDLPGSNHDFFYGLQAAVTRRNEALEPAGGWFPDQALTVEESLRAYSTWAAYSAFWEGQSGSLSPGKWADLTVLNLDPFKVGADDPDGFQDGRIIMTIVGGAIRFEQER